MLRNYISIARRSKKIEKQYRVFRTKHSKCTFCQIGKSELNDVVHENKHFWIITNRFAYEVWDSLPVVSHLLVVPKDHVMDLAELTASERKSLVEILSQYEDHGYSFYGRSPEDVNRSVKHQHTHLIKARPKDAE
jgi:diadenosine tetraphosphate (Ap4A) HIT family hydrolase